MYISFKNFIIEKNPSFEFNWHHDVQCRLIDDWLNDDIKHLMILAPPRSSKTKLMSRMLPWYLNEVISRDKKILHLTYSSTLSKELKIEYYKNCGYRLDNICDSIVKFHGTECSLSSRFDYIIMDDIEKHSSSLLHSCATIQNYYNNDILTRLGHDGKQLLIASHFINDLPSAIIKANDANWTIVKFPLISKEKTPFRHKGEVLWNRMILHRSIDDIKKSCGNACFTTLYQQDDPESIIMIY